MALKQRAIPDVSVVLQARRPDLYSWLLSQHQSFEVSLQKRLRPGWKEIAKALAKAGFAKPDGSPMTADYARLTWWKVRHRLKEAPERHKPPQPVASPPRLNPPPPAPVKSPALTLFAPPSAKDPTHAQAVYRRSVPAK